MARKTIITVVVLLALLALIFWYQQSKNNDDLVGKTDLSISAFNQTKNIDATVVPAAAKDTLVYTLRVENTSDDVISGYVVETDIDDISELATLIDAQGANYDASTNSLMWTPLDISPNGAIEKQFTVRVKDNLPADSDFVISASFGNEVAVNVNKPGTVAAGGSPAPVPAYVAPTSGPSLWFAVLLALMFTIGVIIYKAAKKINV